MASTSELACIYAALALQDDGASITAEKIQAIVSAANITVDPFWPGLYAKALEGVDVKNLIQNIGSSVGATPTPAVNAAPTSGSAAAPSKEEKKKEEPKEESDDDMGFGLFD